MRLGRAVPIMTLAAIAALALAPAGASAADLDCGDFDSQAEAQEHLLPGDPHRLDADDDGVACESNPCPCSTGGGGSRGTGDPPPPPPPAKLSKGAARAAAERKARRYVRRNARVGAATLRRCGRRSRHRVDCSFVARGRDGARLTSCRLHVVVRGEGRAASARLASARCRSRLPVLRRPRARAALQAAASRIAGKRVTKLTLKRLGRTVFVGLGEWSRTAADGETESCLVELTLELRRSGRLHRVVRNRDCFR